MAVCLSVCQYTSKSVCFSVGLSSLTVSVSVCSSFLCLSVCLAVCPSVSLTFHSAILSVCLFVSVRLSFCVPDSPSICQCFFPFVILPVSLFLCVRHFICLPFSACASFFVHHSPSSCQCIFSFFNLSVCLLSVCFCVSDSPSFRHGFFAFVILSVCLFLCVLHFICPCLFLRARYFLCMTVCLSVSESFHSSLFCLSVCSFLCVRHFVCLTVQRFCLSVFLDGCICVYHPIIKSIFWMMTINFTQSYILIFTFQKNYSEFSQ